MKRKLVRPIQKPRISVFRSNQHIYAQVIDDAKHCTIASASDATSTEKNRLARAQSVGEELAKNARAKGITNVMFDRKGYKYHGRIKSLAEGARKGGLIFNI